MIGLRYVAAPNALPIASDNNLKRSQEHAFHSNGGGIRYSSRPE